MVTRALPVNWLTGCCGGTPGFCSFATVGHLGPGTTHP
eukprot:COSAG06_NODE_59667_length_273_cov_0.896552_1_plen_37_part_01